LKKFNVTGICVPGKHYMVNTEEKLSRIMELIKDERYFTINRARQFGKTTTLYLLEKAFLSSGSEYIGINISFEGVGGAMFESEEAFCQEFLIQISEALNGYDFAKDWIDESVTGFAQLGRHINKLCVNKNLVLMVDEVDATSKNSIFLRFLGMLRNLYLKRAGGKANTFHSVILAGVHDIKNIKLKLITAGLHTLRDENEGEYNSPWNIASDFTVDMFFTPQEISTMLLEYEDAHSTGMDIAAVSEEIFFYTAGYPYLVSRICQCIDEELPDFGWNAEGVQHAVKKISFERSVLYDDIFKNLENHKDLYDFMYGVLVFGNKIKFTFYDPVMERCNMFGFITMDSKGVVEVANKIFAILMLNYFISKENTLSGMSSQICNGMYKEITGGGRFDMEICLRRFAEHYSDIYASAASSFLETHGRMIFLSFLKPLVNGVGFFHIESQFTDMRRMDVVVDYGRESFIIELKLWKGEKAQGKAYEQLLDYMNSKRLNKGYLLTFDFRKDKNKETKCEWVKIGDKQIFEVIV